MNKCPVKSRFFRRAGSAACLMTVLAMLGGHWLALQSYAWARMITHYTQQGSLASALSKTFNGRHPCGLCLFIQKGREQEQGERQNLPWVKLGESRELLCESQATAAPLPPAASTPAIPMVPRWHPDLREPPPTPPPRAA
jgi:hypothetical protein